MRKSMLDMLETAVVVGLALAVTILYVEVSSLRHDIAISNRKIKETALQAWYADRLVRELEEGLRHGAD